MTESPMRLLLLLSPLLLTACVPKARYDEALVENASLSQQLSASQSSLAQTQSMLRKLRTQLEDVEKARAEAERLLAHKSREAGALAEDVEQMTQALRELEERKAKAERSLEAYRDLVGRFQAMIDAGTLKVKVIDGRMVVELATDILFAPGSATLSRDGRKAVAEVAEVLASIEDREYQVAGHTDDVPISNAAFPSNWHLGSARAIAVVQVLVDSGLPGERVSAASFAEYEPADTNRTKEGRANNRRIEIIIVPDLSMMPGYEELQALAEGPEVE